MNKAAILVGDHLFSKSFRLMVKPHRMDVLSVLATASSIITEGEISQLTHKGDLTLSLDMYMDVVRAKTATLFGAAAKVGAMSANGTEKICHTLHDMAFNFGMAFQIRDDLMDYGLMGAHRTKNIGDDFYEGKVTLPLLFHYAASSATEQTFLKELINNQNRTNAEFLKIQQAMKEKHIMDHCKEMLHFYLEKAHFGLNAFSGHWLFLPFKDYMAQLFTGL